MLDFLAEFFKEEKVIVYHAVEYSESDIIRPGTA
jgi:hypothetical protein